MNEDLQFDEFVAALAGFDLDEEIQATAHTSAVSVADWKKVEQALGRS